MKMHQIQTGKVDSFIEWTVELERKRRDIEAVLKAALEERKPDLLSDDPQVREDAEEVVCMILDQLYGPRPPLSREEREERASEALDDKSLSPAQRLAEVKRRLRATGRPKGRPSNESSQHAIKGLTMFQAGETWPKIALTLKACKHLCSMCGGDRSTVARRVFIDRRRFKEHVANRRPFKRLEESCSKCGNIPPPSPKLACNSCTEAIRAAVGRLEVLLRRIGYDLNAFPRRSPSLVASRSSE